MSKTTFLEQVRQMWQTKPVRLPDKGPLAGVAAGVGYRYGVDPVLIRVAFVVSTIFGGAGIVLYLAAWLLFTQSGDQASAAESLIGQGRSSESQTKTIVLVVALVIAVSTIGPVGIGLGGTGGIALLLMLGGWWLLHHRQPIAPPLPAGAYSPVTGMTAPGVTGYPGTAYPATPFTAPTTVETTGSTEPAYSPYTRLPDHYEPDAQTEKAESGSTTTREPTPPSWDPLGVAPFAWDLPEPVHAVETPVRVDHSKPRSRLTTVTLGLAILAAAGAGALAFAGADWLSPARVGAVALAVVGLGLIVGAFLRRGYGLLVVTAPLVGFVVIASLIGPIDFDRSTMGESSWRATTAADLRPAYAVSLGSGTLDLTSLKLTGDETVKLDAQFGNIEVRLPDGLDVRKTSSVTAGETTGLPDGLDAGSDGIGGPTLTLDITSRFGSVDVHRGN